MTFKTQRVGHAEILLQRRWRDVLHAEAASVGPAGSSSLSLPSIFDYLSYLRNTTHLEPALRIAANTSRGHPARLVFGIPSVKREIQSYLTSTVENLIANMSPEDRSMSLIVIMLADINNSTKVESELAEVRGVLDEHLRSGLVEVINPPSHFYPPIDKLQQPTLGDPIDRVRWRTKQAYDFAYLMMYASSRGEYYVQLEDDILSKPGFATQMLNFAKKQMSSGHKDFFVLDFCTLGFIGKMFKCIELMKFATYILTFAQDQPVDWILDHYVQTKVCRFDKDAKHCRKMKSTIWITHKPSLFQHVGTHSSLKGKMQKLKDRQFGRVSLFVPHRDNVPGDVVTSMTTYKQYTVKRAYLGDSLFWGVLPVAGDHITVTFHEPTILEKVLFRSGDAEHPNDRFINATIQILPVASVGKNPQNSNQDSGNKSLDMAKPQAKHDGWLELIRFDPHNGLAQAGPVSYPVAALRLVVLTNHDHWGILSEIQVKGSTAFSPNNNKLL
ncbi:alpha-1,3-mannosyl-glycoprotein 4-beta-N-acetylglucosaminyltransferase B-like isoform X2 [Varroa jacobsoni]|uniref:alpha-1,3-mannosyl-glycoprotein 4-beta-N-acetylglucosaminyltransferase B-like isoform X2 n=1 Tax=Varroa jacobsoni TaxID=62625 RepID=UPI000BFA2BD4|nr:alpha-1,3-mannosyl-glycoprotein 4-beta-N-acetylglucosaminyltransferase B-like isoform X2 [Varroa jacobsoni]